MIKHIVMWRVADSLDKAVAANRAKELLEGMSGKIPGLRYIEVGINFADEATAADVLLYTEFDDLAGLDTYQNHPAHEAVKPLIKEMMQERRVVEVEARFAQALGEVRRMLADRRNLIGVDHWVILHDVGHAQWARPRGKFGVRGPSLPASREVLASGCASR